jgi:hypothetical protein
MQEAPEGREFPPDRSVVQRVPKVLLHEHLDGGLRPSTVLELARRLGYEGLPYQTDPSSPSGSTPAPPRIPAPLPRGFPPHDRGDAVPPKRSSASPTNSLRGHGARQRRVRRGALRAALPHVQTGTGPRRRNARGAARDCIAAQRTSSVASVDRVRHAQPASDLSFKLAELAVSPTATRAASASTSPAKRPVTPPRNTCAPSNTSSAPTFRSRSTPAKVLARRASGRRCSTAARTASVTARA